MMNRKEQAAEHCPADQVVNMVLKAGQVALLHNWTLHRSGRNSSQTMARRAFSVNYTWGDTEVVNSAAAVAAAKEKGTGYAEGSNYFPVVFESVADIAKTKEAASHFSEAQLAVMQDRFRDFDKDGDGKITKEELRSVMSALPGKMLESQEQLDKMFAAVDEDNSGEIDFSEFLQMMASVMPAKDDEDARGQELTDAFAKFDANGDGFISRAELGEAMKGINPKITKAQIDTMMVDADADKDGQVSFEEFEKMLKSSEH